MNGVSVRQYGLSFVWECLKRYLGESWLIAAVCLAGMILTALFLTFRKNGPDAEGALSVNRMNFALLIVLALTAYNPVLVRALIPKLGMTAVYYRMFWAFPLIPAAAYYLTCLQAGISSKALRGVVIAGIFASAALLMPLNPGIRYHLQMPDNLYKVQGAIPVICDEIHEDFEQTLRYQRKKKKAEESDPMTLQGQRRLVRSLPRCVFPAELEFQVRQYDPSIVLTFSRDMRLFYEGNTVSGKDFDAHSKSYARKKLILDGMYGRDPGITVEKFIKAMRKTKTNYLIVENDQDSPDFLKVAGCRLVADTAGYHIYAFRLRKA